MSLLDGFKLFFNPAYLVDKLFTFWMSGGGSSTSTGTTYTSNIPEWMKGEQKGLYEATLRQLFTTDAKGNITGVRPYIPYSANPADYVAGFAPTQEQVFSNLANLSVPGQYGQASDFARAAGAGNIGSAQQAYNYGGQGAQFGQLGAGYGSQGAGYGDLAAQIGQMGLQAQGLGQDISAQSQAYAAQQAGAGQQYANQMTDAMAVEAYMSPYMQNVINMQKDAAIRDYNVQRTNRQAAAAKSGAYGGSRQAIQEAEAERALNTQLQAIEAQGLQTAYDKAIQSMQFGTTAGMQGLAGAQAGLGTALQGGQLGLSGVGTALQGLQGGMQGAGLGIQGAQAGMQGAQVGLQGVSGAQAGYSGANQAAANLGNLASAQNRTALDILNAQLGAGGLQQQQQQNIINQAVANYAQAQAYPQEQLGYMMGMLSGMPSPGTVTQRYMPAASTLGTLGSLGTAAIGAKTAGLFNEGGIVKLAKGGMVKSYAEGGDITGPDNIERIAQDLSVQQLQQALQNKTVPEYIGIPLLAQKDAEQKRMQMAQAAMQQQQQGDQGLPTIKDRVLQGIETLPSNLPTEEFTAAGGGIVAFGSGGDVPRYGVGGVPDFPVKPGDLQKYNLAPYEEIYKREIDPTTGQPYTEEAVFAKQKAKREARGIKDIYSEDIKDIEERAKKLPSEEKEMMGWALMGGAFEAMAEGNPDTARYFGSLGAKVSKNAAGVKQDFKDRAKDLRKEKQALRIAQDQANRADLAGDQAAYERAQDRANQARTNLANISNKTVDQANEVLMKGKGAEYDLMGKEILQGMENEGKIRAAMKTQGLDLAKLRNSVYTNTIARFEKEYGTDAVRTKFKGDKAAADARFKEMFAQDFAQALGQIGGESEAPAPVAPNVVPTKDDSGLVNKYNSLKAGETLTIPGKGKFKKLANGNLELISE